jgi:hypothetical protein
VLVPKIDPQLAYGVVTLGVGLFVGVVSLRKA